jgi:hypothetical protein
MHVLEALAGGREPAVRGTLEVARAKPVALKKAVKKKVSRRR